MTLTQTIIGVVGLLFGVVDDTGGVVDFAVDGPLVVLVTSDVVFVVVVEVVDVEGVVGCVGVVGLAVVVGTAVVSRSGN